MSLFLVSSPSFSSIRLEHLLISSPMAFSLIICSCFSSSSSLHLRRSIKEYKLIGHFLTRGLVIIFGYAYSAYECYKTVERNKPEKAASLLVPILDFSCYNDNV
ncbi:hypothetical protein SOVF_160330 [Spinacia oleracea]|nr:hypothetical protein SOVF_160330 [Spinacia oleracea]